MIYMDYAATTPMSKHAIEVYSEVASKYFGNTSSLHDHGASAFQLLEKCREDLAKHLNGEMKGVFFTGGGSDSNYLAIHSLLKANKHKGKHIITTGIEHASLLNIFHELQSEGYDVTYLPVNEYGEINIEDVRASIRPDTVLASIHHANSEIGTLQPLKEIGQILKKKGVVFHSDCVQTFGKEPIDVIDFNLSSVSISSHKIYGPKGVGACYVSPSVAWSPLIENTSHEKGFRPGTINVPGIAAFVTAANDIFPELELTKERMSQLRKMLTSQIEENKWRIIIEQSPNRNLPHIVGLRIKGIEGQYTMLECNRYGVSISTGSACTVGLQEPSKTMTAIGRKKEDAKEFVRLSFGRETTEEHITRLMMIFDRLLLEHFRYQ